MAARDHLLEGETILSASPPFYATDRRLLRSETTGALEEFHDLPYYRVESVEIVRQPWQSLAFGGIAVAFAGILMWSIGIVVTSFPTVALGIGMIIVGARGRKGYYQFRGLQMSPAELARWRVPVRGTTSFLKTIRDHLRRPVR